ncbi:Transcriptional regulator, TetR family [[Actinomadura] parvosata subsp. kistnae]|uniref:TetR/AcrR family transcriptional regulator n=1 Tax=[Actinomadura] parvosata TaxID=1955412 RepID=UPI000D2D03D0|nr:Transcriptional regulator, TetR family [Actinomadura parvosata subsp. kistnae]
MEDHVSASPDPRADRILDAAADLLVQRGYRKVAVEDVAARASIGKGTVYLHWPTKRHLFEAVVVREGIAYLGQLAAELRRDPEAVLPHRLAASTYLIIMGRPVLRALSTGRAPELEIMGLDHGLLERELLMQERLFGLLAASGLIRAGVPDLVYTMKASSMGFYLLDWLEPPTARLDLRRKADALAYTVKHAFEPPVPPGRDVLETVAEQAIALLEEPLPRYSAQIYTYDKKQRTP